MTEIPVTPPPEKGHRKRHHKKQHTPPSSSTGRRTALVAGGAAVLAGLAAWVGIGKPRPIPSSQPEMTPIPGSNSQGIEMVPYSPEELLFLESMPLPNDGLTPEAIESFKNPEWTTPLTSPDNFLLLTVDEQAKVLSQAMNKVLILMRDSNYPPYIEAFNLIANHRDPSQPGYINLGVQVPAEDKSEGDLDPEQVMTTAVYNNNGQWAMELTANGDGFDPRFASDYQFLRNPHVWASTITHEMLGHYRLAAARANQLINSGVDINTMITTITKDSMQEPYAYAVQSRAYLPLERAGVNFGAHFADSLPQLAHKFESIENSGRNWLDPEWITQINRYANNGSLKKDDLAKPLLHTQPMVLELEKSSSVV